MTAHNEMIERVARAIAASDPEQAGQLVEGEMGDYFWEKYREQYLAQARAAIEAMRQPTEAMAHAAEQADPNGFPQLTWRIQIDAALNDEVKT